MMIGVDTLPALPIDPGDRNRTSPFAFTGNRFEFRAPGSMQSIAGPMVMLNTIMAESLDYIATELENAVAAAPTSTPRCRSAHEIITEHGAVVFNGDGYSDNWHIEAAEARPAEPADHPRRPAGADQPRRHGAVREVQGLQPPRDAQPLRDRPRAVRADRRRRGQADAGDRPTLILPAAIRYQTELAQNIGALKAAGVEAGHRRCSSVSAPIGELKAGLATLKAALRTTRRHRRWPRPSTAGTPCCRPCPGARGRRPARGVVADDLWPLPTYQEMLYIL